MEQPIEAPKSIKKDIKYNFNLLQKLQNEYNIEFVKDYTKEKLTYQTIIEAKCCKKDCNNVYKKSFRTIVISSKFCKLCTDKVKYEKSVQTNMNKYGVPHKTHQNDHKEKISKIWNDKDSEQKKQITEKRKQTRIENIKKNPEFKKQIQEKRKQTCKEKYGTENINNLQEIQDKMKKTCMKKYGKEFAFQAEEIINKIKKTNLERYGVTCTLQDETTKLKIMQTNQKKYNVSYPMQSKEIMNKSKETCMKKYGVEFVAQSPDIQEKIKKTCIEKYGTISTTQIECVKEKSKNTCIQRYGVENPQQNINIRTKTLNNSFKLKEYIFPSGKKIKIQGYEPFALDDLLKKEQITEEELLSGYENIPDFWYEDVQNKKHRHYVDIYIPSQNRMIEVKSTWTLEKGKCKDHIFLKQEAGKALGYQYEIWVYDAKGIRVEHYT
jgi:hypothetical protein